MKFYNPFRWHVVRHPNGRYYVRRLSLTGWLYRSRYEDYDWVIAIGEPYCAFAYKEDAIALCKGLRNVDVELVWP